MMRLLVLTVLVTAVVSFRCPEQCKCGDGDEREYWCRVGNGRVNYNVAINKYVNVECLDSNFTCSDLPIINFANNLTLPYLGVTGCSPSMLKCVKQAYQASGVSMITFSDAVEPFQDDDIQGLGDVESLTVYNASDDTIPTSSIKLLRSLRSLRICRSQLELHGDAFVGAPPIKFLELSEDGVTGIPENTFNGLVELLQLSVWGNNINVIGVNSFRGLDSLELLTLNTNQISTIAVGSLTHTPKLKSIKLIKNQLVELPFGFICNLTQVENVTIQYNDVELTLQPKSLSNLTSLRNLNLESNKITSLPEDLLAGSTALRTLSLAHNAIPALPARFFKDQKALEYLDLSYNKISMLSSVVFAPLRKLRTLDLNRNHLEVLPDVLFSGLSNLNYISIDNNFLSKISDTAFQGASGLLTLSLVSNHLTLKEDTATNDQTDHVFGYANFEEQSPFRTLTQLQMLNLEANQVDKIFEDWKTVLLSLKELILSRNRFQQLYTYDIEFLSQNVTIDLRNNNISTIQLQPAPPSPAGTKPPSGALLLDHNPLHCDCGLYNLALRLRGARPLTAEPKFIVDNAKCASPLNLHGDLFKNVSPFDLNCDLPVETCHNTCLTCEFRPARNDLLLDCITVPPTLPNPSEFNVEDISLKLRTAPEFIGNLSVRALNLSNTGLEEILFRPSDSIKVLDLTNNYLKTIPMEFLESNISLYISNNPLECECWYSKEISAIQRSVNIEDLKSVACRNGDKLTQVDVVALCSSWRAAAVASGTFVVLALIATISALAIYRNSHEILIYITKKGLFPWCFVEDLTDADKEYDVFVSYAHKDRQFFLQLLPKLEGDFEQKTCVHYRDWSVGDLIPDQINRSVESSRKTIILLSNNFLESAYANMEFRAAHNLALKEGRSRVILILLEDVTSHEKLSEELTAYIKTNTYLSWDDPRFWERLHRALPRRLNKKFVWPDVFGQAGEKTEKSGLDVQLNSQGQLVNVAVKDV